MNDEYEYPIYKEWIEEPGLVYKFTSIKRAVCMQQQHDVKQRQDSVHVGKDNNSMVPHNSASQWRDIVWFEQDELSIYELLNIKDANG